MPCVNSWSIIMPKEIIKGSVIGSSNQATKWAALLVRSLAVSDSVARCAITIGERPDCFYAWHWALGSVAAWGLFTPPFGSPKGQPILNSRYRAKSVIATNSSVEISASLARQSPNCSAIARRLSFFTLRAADMLKKAEERPIGLNNTPSSARAGMSYP